jgi:hypothetical protein
MPQLIKPSDVKFITQDGECKIALSLELDINLNLNGDGLSISAKQSQQSIVDEDDDDDKVGWVAPNFGGKKIKFGKEIEE